MFSLRGRYKFWLAEMAIGHPQDGKHHDPIFTAPLVVQALVGGVAASVVSGMIQGKPSSPGAAPAVTPPTPMPTPGDAGAEATRRASIAEQLRRRGRASTILTDPAAGDAPVSPQSQAVNTSLGGT